MPKQRYAAHREHTDNKRSRVCLISVLPIEQAIHELDLPEHGLKGPIGPSTD